jgi:hypothetical protein
MQTEKNVAPKSGELETVIDPDAKSSTKSPPGENTETASAAPPDISDKNGHH